MQRWTTVVVLSVLVLMEGCANLHDPQAETARIQRNTQETQRLQSLGFQAGALALGQDSLAGVPIDVYRLPSDPDRDTFAQNPSRLKTAWEFQMLKVQPMEGCRPDRPPTFALNLVFADEAIGQAFPLENTWAMDCRHPTAMPAVFHTAKGQPTWVMFPAPTIDSSVTPAQVHFLTQHDIKPSTPGLPLSVASLVVSQPMTLTLRWRARAAAGRVLPWTTQTITVRPLSVFTEPYCAALQEAHTPLPEVRRALVQHDCGAVPVLPSGLRTTP